MIFKKIFVWVLLLPMFAFGQHEYYHEWTGVFRVPEGYEGNKIILKTNSDTAVCSDWIAADGSWRLIYKCDENDVIGRIFVIDDSNMEHFFGEEDSFCKPTKFKNVRRVPGQRNLPFNNSISVLDTIKNVKKGRRTTTNKRPQKLPFKADLYVNVKSGLSLRSGASIDDPRKGKTKKNLGVVLPGGTALKLIGNKVLQSKVHEVPIDSLVRGTECNCFYYDTEYWYPVSTENEVHGYVFGYYTSKKLAERELLSLKGRTSVILKEQMKVRDRPTHIGSITLDSLNQGEIVTINDCFYKMDFDTGTPHYWFEIKDLNTGILLGWINGRRKYVFIDR